MRWEGEGGKGAAEAEGAAEGEEGLWEGGEGGVCLHLQLSLRPHRTPRDTTKAVEEAEQLAALTAAIREAPDDASRYYARACRLLPLKQYAEAVSQQTSPGLLCSLVSSADLRRARPIWSRCAMRRRASASLPASRRLTSRRAEPSTS